MSDKPKAVKLTLEQTEKLKRRIFETELPDEDKELLSGLIGFNLWLNQQLSRASFTIRRLRGLFGFSTEKKNTKKTEEVVNENTTDTRAANGESETPQVDDSSKVTPPTSDVVSSTSNPTPKQKPEPKWSEAANHGRYGYQDYPGLEQVVLSHPDLKAGDACPKCAAANQLARVSNKTIATYIRLVGSPIVTGTCYIVEGCRCNLCDEVYKPEVPKEITEAPKYDASAVSNIAINHYAMGMPFKRIEFIQQSAGIPLADATQYDKMAGLKTKLKPLYECMLKFSVNSNLMHYDDTPMRILESGSGHGTAIVSKHEDHWIYLYYTSDKTAGKTVSGLVKDRTSDEPLLTMVDGSNQNHLTGADETLLSRLVVIYCLVHGRRKFHELLKDFPEFCSTVIESIADVYRNEAHCRQHQFSDEERLDYHQKFSEPIMASLHVYLTNLWQYDKIEHNSPLGDAVKYMLQRWEGLTQFLRIAGCPIDNNICERAIKVLIRYRKNSGFYRTLQGAMCGNIIMSVIVTAIRNGANPFDYLNALQDYHSDMALNPEAFMPWNYQATLQAMTQSKAA